MKITIDRAHFAAAAKIAATVAPRRPSDPVHGAVLLETAGDGIRVTATDGEAAISVRVPVVPGAVAEPGAVAVPAHRLAAVVADAPADVLTLSATDRAVTVAAGAARTRLPAWAASEAVPAPRRVDASLTVRGPAASLRAYLDRVAALPAAGAERWGLNGTALHVRDGVAVAVATDGHRAHKIGTSADLTVDGTPPEDALLAGDGARTLARALAAVDSAALENGAVLELGTAAARVVWADGYAWVAMLHGTAPDVGAIVPVSARLTLRVRPADLAAAVTRAARLRPSVALTVDAAAGAVVVSVDGSDGAHSEPVAAEIDGAADAPIGLAAGYLTAALSCVGGEVAQIGCNGALSPVTVTAAGVAPSMDGRDAFALIMPVRLD